ncbi:hypothetical protein C8C76_12321 [Halanaerobium saccharolyticum]|jgi:hypothetical protein|uniref:Uncharacterized protein n=1 Tax=Halanaerobium saccharolyticum TaxID=43595 RepID=A0A2T5RI12_9FIRM|nr:hypothetical protein [Halanaerobium saccharolyticum]PTV97770.1 hypothetical protein C8C76_12321 [Halanaerobium saccharolyticum]TDP88624.1 hypothetical protein C7957_1361 [Halanaerobium saccharolyticum]
MENYKIDFNSFIERNPRHQKFSDNQIAKEIYNLLAEGENIYRMMVFSELEIPALAASISEIEDLYGEQEIFNLNNSFSKQTMGVMVKDILRSFGYDNTKSKDIPKGLSKYVNTAAVYKKLDTPSKNLKSSFEIVEFE